MARINTNRKNNQYQKDKVMSQDTQKDVVAETVVDNTDTGLASETAQVAEAVVNNTDTGLAPETAKVKEDVVTKTSNQEEIATIKAARSEDPLLKALAASLEIYKEKMAPKKPIASAAGARQQQELYRTIISVFSSSDKAIFKQGKELLLTFFANNKKDGVMNDRYRLRFVNDWTLGEDSLKSYMILLNMFDILTDVSIKKKKQVFNTEEILNTSVNEAMSENLSEFLGPIA